VGGTRGSWRGPTAAGRRGEAVPFHHMAESESAIGHGEADSAGGQRGEMTQCARWARLGPPATGPIRLESHGSHLESHVPPPLKVGVRIGLDAPLPRRGYSPIAVRRPLHVSVRGSGFVNWRARLACTGRPDWGEVGIMSPACRRPADRSGPCGRSPKHYMGRLSKPEREPKATPRIETRYSGSGQDPRLGLGFPRVGETVSRGTAAGLTGSRGRWGRRPMDRSWWGRRNPRGGASSAPRLPVSDQLGIRPSTARARLDIAGHGPARPPSSRVYAMPPPAGSSPISSSTSATASRASAAW
jgi:hypothetical protein